MATRLKTIQYVIPGPTTVADNTLTALTTITAYLPEFSGTVTIKKAWLDVWVQNGAGAAVGNVTGERVDVSVGGAGATTYTWTGTRTGSGEDKPHHWSVDCTSHFTANWTSGTSQTVAVSILLDHSATSAWVNPHAILFLTYEYDDAQTTQIKTVLIPMDAPVGLLASSKPGTANATIPALDTELPESTKTIRSLFVVWQGNINATASTTDSTLSCQVDSYTAFTTETLEMGATSDYWIQLAPALKYYDSGGSAAGIGMDTSATHGLYLWGSVARFNHGQVWLVVTYAFDASASSNCYVSVQIPLTEGGLAGGTAATDFQRLVSTLWIEEPATITTMRLGAYLFWEQVAPIQGVNARLGTGSFVTYTDASNVICGSNGLMIRNDAAFTLTRGRNSLTVDVYRTDTNDLMHGLTGFLLVCYTSGKPSGGYGAANHTVQWPIGLLQDGGATAVSRTFSATTISLPESSYALNAAVLALVHWPDSINFVPFEVLLIERTNASGQWVALSRAGYSDGEQGVHLCYWNLTPWCARWPSDGRRGPDEQAALDVEGTRRYLAAQGLTGYYALVALVTYHTITFTVSGTVSGYADADGAGLTVEIWRNTTPPEKVAEATTTTGGAYTATVYDNSLTHFATCREDSTHVGRSDNVTPS
jgi:hypothetical protein